MGSSNSFKYSNEHLIISWSTPLSSKPSTALYNLDKVLIHLNTHIYNLVELYNEYKKIIVSPLIFNKSEIVSKF